jgi:hypothetical protein
MEASVGHDSYDVVLVANCQPGYVPSLGRYSAKMTPRWLWEERCTLLWRAALEEQVPFGRPEKSSRPYALLGRPATRAGSCTQPKRIESTKSVHSRGLLDGPETTSIDALQNAAQEQEMRRLSDFIKWPQH